MKDGEPKELFFTSLGVANLAWVAYLDNNMWWSGLMTGVAVSIIATIGTQILRKRQQPPTDDMT